MLVHTCHLNTQETKAEWSPVQGQSGLHSKALSTNKQASKQNQDGVCHSLGCTNAIYILVQMVASTCFLCCHGNNDAPSPSCPHSVRPGEWYACCAVERMLVQIPNSHAKIDHGNVSMILVSGGQRGRQTPGASLSRLVSSRFCDRNVEGAGRM